MAPEAYGTLAEVYEWLVIEPLLSPQGSAEAFAQVTSVLPPGARVLDCAAGTGQLAVGLALQGFDVVATDAAAAMIARTRALAAGHDVRLPAIVCPWQRLDEQGWEGSFDAVLCVGNSLTHAPGRAARRAALRNMAGTLRAGGLLAVTSRNWERVREEGPGLQVGEDVVERHGRRGLVIRSWTMAGDWDDEHFLDVAVAFPGDDGQVTTHAERLSCWPFRHETLDEDLRAAGLSPEASTYSPEADRYLVTARRA